MAVGWAKKPKPHNSFPCIAHYLPTFLPPNIYYKYYYTFLGTSLPKGATLSCRVCDSISSPMEEALNAFVLLCFSDGFNGFFFLFFFSQKILFTVCRKIKAST